MSTSLPSGGGFDGAKLCVSSAVRRRPIRIGIEDDNLTLLCCLAFNLRFGLSHSRPEGSHPCTRGIYNPRTMNKPLLALLCVITASCCCAQQTALTPEHQIA